MHAACLAAHSCLLQFLVLVLLLSEIQTRAPLCVAMMLGYCVHAAACSHCQVSDIQESQVAHQIRKCQAARVDNTCQAAFECLVFCEHHGTFAIDRSCTQQAPRCAADIPEVWYMQLHLVATKLAIVMCNTAKSDV